MITRELKLKLPQLSNFGRLVNYITGAQEKNIRVEGVQITNCLNTTNIAQSVLEVEARQSKNTSSKADKTYHLLISFPSGEYPTKEQLREIEQKLCASIGLGNHQRISAVHADTDNLHIHVAINKINPVTNAIHEPYQSKKRLNETAETLEKALGLQRTNHKPNKTASENKVADMERHSGLESLATFVKTECLDAMRQAQTWNSVHRVLAEKGLTIRERGNGLVILNSNGLAIKASTASRDISKAGLVARLGEYVPPPPEVSTAVLKSAYKERPIKSKINTDAMFQQYQQERSLNTATKRDKLAIARVDKEAALHRLKVNHAAKRAAIKMLRKGSVSKRLLYGLAASAYKREMANIRSKAKSDQSTINATFEKLIWADWLRTKANTGDANALVVLRARKSGPWSPQVAQSVTTKPGVAQVGTKPPPKGQGILRSLSRLASLVMQAPPGHQVLGSGSTTSIKTPGRDSITKHGTIIYARGSTAIRDEGTRINVSTDASTSGIGDALRIAAAHYGNTLTLTGSDKFKAQAVQAAVVHAIPIQFADPALEARRNRLLNQINKGNLDNERPSRHRAGLDRRSARTRTGTGTDLRERANGDFQPYARSAASEPPAAARHRLRNLSQLSVVQLTPGSEMLLPRNVSGDVEQQRTQSADKLRRNLSQPRVETLVPESPPDNTNSPSHIKRKGYTR